MSLTSTNSFMNNNINQINDQQYTNNSRRYIRGGSPFSHTSTGTTKFYQNSVSQVVSLSKPDRIVSPMIYTDYTSINNNSSNVN